MRRPRWFDRTLLILAIVCAVVLIGLAAVFYLPMRPNSLPPLSVGPPTRFVVIEGVDLMLSYQATMPNDTGYFESPECGACPLNETPSGQWFFQFVLQNNGTSSHRFDGLSVSAPFSVVSTQPTPPVVFAPRESEVIGVTLQLPSTPGYYFLEGTINAS